MCEPVSLIGFGLSAAGSIMNYSAQQQAHSQSKRDAAINDYNARINFGYQQRDLNTRQVQEQEAAAAKRFDAHLEAQRAKSTATVAAGEGGVTGLSVVQLLGDYDAKAGRYKDRVDQQLEGNIANIESQKKGSAANALDRINSVKVLPKPSFIDAGLRIASAGVNAWSGAQKNIDNGGTQLW